VALNPSGAKPLLKLPNPLQNSLNQTTEDNYNMYTHIVVVKTKQNKKSGEMGCEHKNVKRGENGAWAKMVRWVRDCGRRRHVVGGE
jgi:hypothetical protein